MSRPTPCAAALLIVAASWGCARQSVEARPPIVLLTVEGLRSDFARPEVLPSTAELFAEGESCRGTAISPAAATAPAVSSLLTGLSPWRHRVLLEGQALPDEFRTVAEALGELGYHSAAFNGRNEKAESELSWDQGLDSRGKLAQAEPLLHALTGGQFVWLHLAVAPSRYRGLAAGDSRVAGLDSAESLRVRRGISRSWLETAQRRGRLSPGVRAAAIAAYESSVMAADGRLENLWSALRSSPRFADALVVLVGVQGDPLGEGGHWQRGRNLDRSSLSVPLWIRWPRKGRPSSGCVEWDAETPSTRVFATLLEAAGIDPPPGVAPSLRRSGPVGALSELYRLHGANQFSWISSGRQLIWTTQFSNARPRSGRRADRRLAEAFAKALPLSDGGSSSGVAFAAVAGSAALSDADLPAGARADLEAAFLAFVDRERAPLEEVGEVP